MSNTKSLKDIIFSKTLHIPVPKEKLFDKITIELFKLNPPIVVDPWYFYQPAWNCSNFEEYMDFKVDLEYFYMLKKIPLSRKVESKDYERIRREYRKNVEKMIDNQPSFLHDGDPYKIHIDVLRNDDSGCDIELECRPFLYYNLVKFKANINDLEKQNAILGCERFLKTLTTGLKAKELT
jgi:hypothetical protein